MNTRLEWREPDVVFEWDKQQSIYLFRKAWLAITKAIWLLWVLVLPAAWYYSQIYEPADLAGSLTRLFLLGLLFPSSFTLLVFAPVWLKIILKYKDRYEVTEKGISLDRVTQCPRIGWRRISEYRFVDHSEIPGIRVLEFRIKGTKPWYQLDLNPQQVEESEIKAVFDIHFKGQKATQ